MSSWAVMITTSAGMRAASLSASSNLEHATLDLHFKPCSGAPDATTGLPIPTAVRTCLHNDVAESPPTWLNSHTPEMSTSRPRLGICLQDFGIQIRFDARQCRLQFSAFRADMRARSDVLEEAGPDVSNPVREETARTVRQHRTAKREPFGQRMGVTWQKAKSERIMLSLKRRRARV